jgi:hypothetical protein
MSAKFESCRGKPCLQTGTGYDETHAFPTPLNLAA